jgi:hypothetical protein
MKKYSFKSPNLNQGKKEKKTHKVSFGKNQSLENGVNNNINS